MSGSAPERHARMHDDFVLPFNTVKSGMRGRVVRLGAVADAILGQHDYPLAVSELLGQALALAAMLGTALKFSGDLTIQSQTDGAVSMFVANFSGPGSLRGYAAFDQDRIASTANGDGRVDQAALIGQGLLALTIDPGEDMERYQGVVSLEGGDLAGAAHTYFRQSEQLPTFVRLAVARHHVAGTDVQGSGWQWRAGGLIVQHISPIGGRPHTESEAEAGAATKLFGEEDDHWRRVEMLAATVEDHELLDPLLSPERLLYRLFHEEGVRVVPHTPLEPFCRCSRERVATFLKTFADENISDLRDENGNVTVTCEFCGTAYRFEPETGRPLD